MWITNTVLWIIKVDYLVNRTYSSDSAAIASQSITQRELQFDRCKRLSWITLSRFLPYLALELNVILYLIRTNNFGSKQLPWITFSRFFAFSGLEDDFIL